LGLNPCGIYTTISLCINNPIVGLEVPWSIAAFALLQFYIINIIK